MRQARLLILVLMLVIGATAGASAQDPLDHQGVVDDHATADWHGGEPFTENAPLETEFDLDDAEVTWYAERHGVSLERSLEIANWMTSIGPLIEDLNQELPGNYADVKVVHGGAKGDLTMSPGDLRVEIRLVDSSDRAFQERLDRIESVSTKIGGVEVRVFEVPKSLDELDQEADRKRRASTEPVDIEYNFDTGSLIVKPVDYDWMQRAKDSQTVHDCPSVDQGKLDGGRRVRFDKGGNDICGHGLGACTTGPGVYFKSRRGIGIAGHCLEGYPTNSSGFIKNQLEHTADMYWVSQPKNVFAQGYPYWYDTLPDDDAGVVARRFTNTEVPGRIWKWDTKEWRLTTHHEWSARAKGLTVCMASSDASNNGADTYCGEVIDPYVNAGGGNVGGFHRWTKLDMTSGSFNEGMGPGPGGSGSPVFWGGTVYGVQTGCSDKKNTCTPLWYYQSRYFWNAMQSYDTDSAFICDHDGNRWNNGVRCDPH